MWRKLVSTLSDDLSDGVDKAGRRIGQTGREARDTATNAVHEHPLTAVRHRPGCGAPSGYDLSEGLSAHGPAAVGPAARRRADRRRGCRRPGDGHACHGGARRRVGGAVPGGEPRGVVARDRFSVGGQPSRRGFFAGLALAVYLSDRARARRRAERMARATERVTADIALAKSLVRSAGPILPVAAFLGAFFLARRRR